MPVLPPPFPAKGAQLIDYRKMLLAYISNVLEAEGVDFLGSGPTAKLDGLSDEEAVELAKLRDVHRHPDSTYYDEKGEPRTSWPISPDGRDPNGLTWHLPWWDIEGIMDGDRVLNPDEYEFVDTNGYRKLRLTRAPAGPLRVLLPRKTS